MNFLTPNQQATESLGTTMYKLGIVSAEEARQMDVEDGVIVEGEGESNKGENLAEGKGGSLMGEMKDYLKSCMKDYMGKYDADMMKSFMKKAASYMKENPKADMAAMKSYMGEYAKKHMKSHMKEDEGFDEDTDLDEESFFEDDETTETTTEAEGSSFFEDEDLAEGDDEDDDEDDDDEDEKCESIDRAGKVIEGFDALTEEEFDRVEPKHLLMVIEAHEDLADAAFDDGEEVEIEEATVRARSTARGRRKARKSFRKGKAKARMARAKTRRRTKHMSARQKARWLAKKQGKSVRELETQRAKARSRRMGGKSVKVRRSYGMDYEEGSDKEFNIFEAIGQVRCLLTQPPEFVDLDRATSVMHECLDTIKGMAEATVSEMKKEIDENEVSEDDMRFQAMRLFETVGKNVDAQNERIDEGNCPIFDVIENIERMLGDIMRGKENCRNID